jgi:hypothetical protein
MLIFHPSSVQPNPPARRTTQTINTSSKVLSKEDEATAEFVVETNLTKGQLRGEDQIPIHPGAGRKPFVLGEPLMWPELMQMVPTSCINGI